MAIKVEYEHDLTVCGGTIKIWEDGKLIYDKHHCCYSTGAVYHDGNYSNWVVEDGELLWDEREAGNFSAEVREAVSSKLGEFLVCCGACI